MKKNLSKKELKKKKKFHETKAKLYQKKIDQVEEDSKRIGFKWYN